MIDYGKLKQLTGIVNTVLSYDLGKLHREDAIKRVGFYNQLVTSENIFEKEFLSGLPLELKEYTLGQFSFAKLRLAAAERVNSESTGISENFNSSELSLVPTFDKYNAFDISNPEELAEKLRREGNISNLAREYQNEYKMLDTILDDPEIRKDLKVFLKKQYKDRLKNVNDGIQFYIGKYGPKDFFERLANKGIAVTGKSATFKAVDDKETEQPKSEKVERYAEKERALDDGLNEIEKTKIQLALQGKALQSEKNLMEAKRQEITEKLKQLTEVPEGEPVRFITREDARKYELDFIARFDTKMNKLPIRIYSPLEKKTFEIRNWNEGEHITSSEKTIPDMPWNTRSLYIVNEKKLLGDKIKRVAIEAVSYNHLDEFEQFGFDRQKASTGELLSLITGLIDTAELGEYLHIIGISSPTGWEEKLIEEFKSSGMIRNYVSRFVSFCLIDSVTGEVFYNTSDERIAGLSDFFKPEFDHEKVEKVTKYVLSRLGVNGYAVFDDILKEANESRQIVNKVFFDLQKEGKSRIRQIKDVGLVLQSID